MSFAATTRLTCIPGMRNQTARLQAVPGVPAAISSAAKHQGELYSVLYGVLYSTATHGDIRCTACAVLPLFQAALLSLSPLSISHLAGTPSLQQACMGLKASAVGAGPQAAAGVRVIRVVKG